jgi:integrase
VHFTDTLKPTTRQSYRKLMLQVEDKWGSQRVAAFDKATMAAWYQALYRGKSPTMAQKLIRQMSILFEHAETLGWRPENSNPCARLKIKTPAPRDRLASWAEIDAVIDAANTLGYGSLALAIHLSIFQGQRQTDVIEATRGAFRLLDTPDPATGKTRPEWTWTLLRSKNQKFAILPVHPEVLPLLRRALAETGTATAPRTDDDVLILDEATGKPYTVDLFCKRWAKARALAATRFPAIKSLKFRDLRSSFSRLARAAGASDDDTGDALGNSAATNPNLRQTYMPASFETARRAVLAVQRPHKTEKKEQAK